MKSTLKLALNIALVALLALPMIAAIGLERLARFYVALTPKWSAGLRLRVFGAALLVLLTIGAAWYGKHATAPVHPQSMQNPGLAPEAKLIKPLNGGPDWPLCPTPVPDDWYCQ